MTDMECVSEGLEARVREFLAKAVERSGLDLRARFRTEEGVLQLLLHGPDSDLVLANNGRLLYALDHLVNQIFFRPGSGASRVVVDCKEYRSTRELELRLLAQKAAERVKTTGSPLPLQPMPSAERRIIHLTLAEEPGVRTESSGAGFQRHVVILPGT